MPSAEFTQAADATKKFTVKPSNEHLLELYALFKIAHGETPEAGGIFNPTAKAKYNAWKKEKDEGTTPEQAEQKYIALVEELKTTYKYDENKVPEVTK